MSCGNGDATYVGVFGGLAETLDSGIDGILQKIAGAILQAAVNLFADVAANVPTLDKNDTYHSKISLQINWLVITIAVGSLLFAAIRMALERRGQAGTTALKGLLKMVLVATAGTFVVTELGSLADDYTTHLYQDAIKKQLQVLVEGCSDDNSLTTFLLIIIGLLLLIAGIVHIILLYLRLGVMVLLFGTLPLAAAASMTEWGSSWWRKHIAWMVAWLAFKPAVALILYVGMVMVTTGGASAAQLKIAGCGVLLLSAIALPALLRLVVPAAAALGSGDATPAAVSAGVGAGAKATGAVAVPAMKYAMNGGRGSAGGSGPSGASGSSGATGAGGANGSPGAAGAGRHRGRRLAAGTAAAGVLAATRIGTAAAHHGTNAANSALPGVHDDPGR